MTRTHGDGRDGAVEPVVVPAPDGDEIAQFWHLARGRAGLGCTAYLRRAGAASGRVPTPDTPVVLETFEVRFPPRRRPRGRPGTETGVPMGGTAR
jgi:hypothetical protein